MADTKLAVKCEATGDKKTLKRKTKESIFLFFLLLFPILHFLIFYVAVNANSILLAFKSYDLDTGKYFYYGFGNFTKFIKGLFTDPILKMSFKNSIWLYAVGLVVGMPLNILVAYSIFRKVPFSGFFRVILFLPSIISSIVFVLIFRYFVELGIPKILQAIGISRPPQLLVNPKYAFGTMIFYGLWTGFGVGIILYTNAMTKISDSIIEFGKLEGIRPLQELWHVVIPMIFPTITTFLVTGVAGLFMSSGAVFSFYKEDAQGFMYTFGYYLFIKVIGQHSSIAEYPFASAAGLFFTIIAAPITLLVKWLLEKFGPSSEY